MGRKRDKPRNYISTAVNPIIGTGLKNPTSPLQGSKEMSTEVRKNLSNYIAPVQLQRIKYDVRLWREAVYEAEYAYYPHRVKMQRMFRDTNLNGHVKACVQKRNRLTTLRDFTLCVNDVENEEWTKLFKKRWFYQLVTYCLSANYYGYTLVSLGSIFDGVLKEVKLIQRWNISPDRYNVTSYVYATSGKCFLDDDVKDWHLYVSTPSEDGQSPCGYGLYYNIAIYEIILRNNLGYNTDFTERFSMPYVHGKTSKTDESERGEFEMAIANMGSAGYAITDPLDEIQFLEAALAGTGWNGYDNLEGRLQKTISKVILGHSDAMDSTPGKLGSGQNDKHSPVNKALSEVQTEDGRMIEEIVNDELLLKLRNIGLSVPEGLTFKYKNDDEEQDSRDKEDTSNQATALVAKTLKDAGMKMSPDYFTERTGIPVEEIEEPEPEPEPKNGAVLPLPSKIQNKLKNLYK